MTKPLLPATQRKSFKERRPRNIAGEVAVGSVARLSAELMLLSHNSSKIVNPRRLTSRTPKTKQTLLLEDNMLKRWLMLKTL